MAVSPLNQLAPRAHDTEQLRRDAGLWLRDLRKRRGLNQRELADLVGAAYYPFISMLEAGRGRIQADKYEAWAEALDVPPAEFVKTLMKYFDPVTYELLFQDEAEPTPNPQP